MFSYKRLYLEAPLITEDAVEALKMVSSDETRGLAPLQLLKEMVVRRPTKQLVFLNVLLCHTGHENNTVRLKILYNAFKICIRILILYKMKLIYFNK